VYLVSGDLADHFATVSVYVPEVRPSVRDQPERVTAGDGPPVVEVQGKDGGGRACVERIEHARPLHTHQHGQMLQRKHVPLHAPQATAGAYPVTAAAIDTAAAAVCNIVAAGGLTEEHPLHPHSTGLTPRPCPSLRPGDTPLPARLLHKPKELLLVADLATASPYHDADSFNLTIKHDTTAIEVRRRCTSVEQSAAVAISNTLPFPPVDPERSDSLDSEGKSGVRGVTSRCVPASAFCSDIRVVTHRNGDSVQTVGYVEGASRNLSVICGEASHRDSGRRVKESKS
jgi:hypothetical protein